MGPATRFYFLALALLSFGFANNVFDSSAGAVAAEVKNNSRSNLLGREDSASLDAHHTLILPIPTMV